MAIGAARNEGIRARPSPLRKAERGADHLELPPGRNRNGVEDLDVEDDLVRDEGTQLSVDAQPQIAGIGSSGFAFQEDLGESG